MDDYNAMLYKDDCMQNTVGAMMVTNTAYEEVSIPETDLKPLSEAERLQQLYLQFFTPQEVWVQTSPPYPGDQSTQPPAMKYVPSITTYGVSD